MAIYEDSKPQSAPKPCGCSGCSRNRQTAERLAHLDKGTFEVLGTDWPCAIEASNRARAAQRV
jgi:hypothetical protein